MKGVYLVIDPAEDHQLVLERVGRLKEEKLAAIQIWDRPNSENLVRELLPELLKLYNHSRVPILVNNQWELVLEFGLDGVHFDEIPEDLAQIEQQIGRAFLKGVTLTNDLNIALQAEEMNFDYLSFCSVFPSRTSNSCERVNLDTINRCRKLTDLPIFLSGGITPENLVDLKDLSFDGIAVVSGILHADNTLEMYYLYQEKLNNLKIRK